MSTFQAIFSNGVLRPLEPLGLAEGQRVDVTISSPSAPTESEADLIRRIRECKTYQEWLDITQLLPPDDGDFNIVEALAENRRWSGDTPAPEVNDGHG